MHMILGDFPFEGLVLFRGNHLENHQVVKESPLIFVISLFALSVLMDMY